MLGVMVMEANQLVTVDQLLDRVWGGQPPSRGRETVYNYVSRLRTALRAAGDEVRLHSRSGGYLLTVDEQAADIHRFRALVTQGRGAHDDQQAVELFEQALRLWRGEPMSELDTPWATGLRATLDGERLAAELDHVDAALRCGRHAELLPSLSARATQHPLDERAAGQMMLALYRCGRQADALQHYEALRRQLADELGADPGPDTQYLFKQILTAEPELAQPRTRPLAAADDPAPAVRLDRAAEELSTAVKHQWTAEAEIRSLHRPAPVRVRWSTTGRPVTREREALRGDILDMAKKFRGLATPQLVVLGEPGAGKTVLATLLTLGLLVDRGPGDPTPVLLSLSSWNPHREHLRSWLARRMLEDYPGLGNAKAYGPDAATRLVAEDRVIPVLDGLDEMAPGVRAAAIDALDRAITGGRPLVVTCRAAEYENAVRHGDILASAAVVEIEPVELDDAVTFLTAGRLPGDTRWQPVVEHLRHHRDAPLAQALSTPLMVDLARTTYRDVASDPAALIDPQRFRDRAVIEDHLLGAFLPAVYAQRPQPPGLPPSTARSYGPDQAQRWLMFLACHLRSLRTRDLAWWQLGRAIPRHVRGLVFGLPPAALFAIVGLLVRGPAAAWVYGLSTAAAGFAAQGWGTRPAPSRVEFRFRGTAVAFLGRALIGVAISIVIGLLWSLSIGPVVILALVFGLSTGLPVWLETPTKADHASSPATTYAQDRVATLAFALSVAVSIGLFYAFAISVSQPHSNLGPAADPFHLNRALPAAGVSALFGWFAFRYIGAASYGLAGFVVGGLAMAHHISLGLGLTAGAVFGLAVGLTAALSRSWGAYQPSRAWLALRGQIPLQLNRFLQNAHRRGVLRLAGALYQFRHTRLHDRLADGRPHER
ncbi:winged helix-turn-helix domain-containing protein [Dactylosporangium roseum]|uniref:Winged helix-turn-helix domain-containing protein n=1 Tax=Dactylosporangium roseum TaxID=47989 RepID=A0ABY5YY26_9ACTN|nr:BTAD domain-containing putative transcriptional regulator [Dactylosporangium roseum]UWZ34646.1 winged helix-turn-helix domain-containing protein [Dactylosporangium roseum]